MQTKLNPYSRTVENGCSRLPVLFLNNYQKVLPIFAMLLLALCTIVATLATSAAAQTQNEVSQGPLTHENTTTNNITSYVDANSTSIFSVSQARDLILNTICANQACNPDARDFYSIIHLLKWSDVSATNTQTVTAEHWYVYRSGRWYQNQFTDDMRLFGANSIYLLYIHLNKPVLCSTTICYMRTCSSRQAESFSVSGKWSSPLSQHSGSVNLEKAAQRYEKWIESRSPRHIAAMREFMKQMRTQTAKAA